MKDDARRPGALAHVAPDGRGHDLREHLEGVAALARRFGEPLGCAEPAALAGLWHDLGKYSGDFQRMIHSANGIEAHIEAEGNERDHSTAGAIHALERGGAHFYPIMAAIAGHHAGLADVQKLRDRIAARKHLYRAVLAQKPPADLLDRPLPDLPSWLSCLERGDGRGARRLEMWGRMLFSALCDADFLDTEEFFEASRSRVRLGRAELVDLAARLRTHMEALEAGAPDTAVNRLRRNVRAASVAAAAGAPGIFTLTVPTGGGKTLAALVFAIEHALSNQLDRVVVVIPYTSIIEQTAANYRAAVGADAVVEHHSALDPVHETPRNRVATENWDAPIIVTTTVQLFESLFARRPGACRKLHNLARSVIVLDEAQALPGKLLPAILDGLGSLVAHYGASVVVSTATQPAWQRSDRLREGFAHMVEICPPEMRLFEQLRRADVTWPAMATRTSYEEVARDVAAEATCLAIVHRRDDARELCQKLDAILGVESAVHLSALMTPAHRSAVLAEVRKRQRSGEPLRVVATQLVEAGVDLDFPVVFRALAGLDSLAQAAGRCNREGRLVRGQLRVFHASTDPPDGVLRTGRDLAALALRSGVPPDIFDPSVQRDYFLALYDRTDLRKGKEIQKDREKLNYATVAAAFRLIEDGWSVPLVVAHGDGARRVAELRDHGPSRGRLRALQRFTINVPRRALGGWAAAGLVSIVADTVHVLEGPALAAYDDRFGLVPERVGVIDPAYLIVG